MKLTKEQKIEQYNILKEAYDVANAKYIESEKRDREEYIKKTGEYPFHSVESERTKELFEIVAEAFDEFDEFCRKNGLREKKRLAVVLV